MAKKKSLWRTITLRELAPFVKDYGQALPGWRVVGRDGIARYSGPVAQQVGFERLSIGDYRPICSIEVLVAPGAGGLPQFLTPPNESVHYTHHERYLSRVVEAMRREFVPSVTKPLDACEVLSLLEAAAVPRPPEVYTLAALNAYLGNEDAARGWIAKYSEIRERFGGAGSEGDLARKKFLGDLAQWLTDGTAHQHMAEILESERQRLNLS